MDVASENRQPKHLFWDMAALQAVPERLEGWLDALFAGLAADGGIDPRHLTLRLGDGVALTLPVGRLASEITRNAAAEATRQNRLSLAGRLPGQSGVTGAPTAIAFPLDVAGVGRGQLTIEAVLADEAALQRMLAQVTLALGWAYAAGFEADRNAGDSAEAAALSTLEAIVTFITRARFSEAARALMTDLATRFDCDRVALGLARGARIRLSAVSNTGSFSRSQGLALRLRAAMEEAFDQERVLLWPVPEGADADMVLDRQAELAADAGPGGGRSVLSLPLFDGQRYRGVILFERASGDAGAFDATETARIEALCGLLTPIILEKRDNDRSLPVRAAVALREQAAQVFGRSHLVAKLSVVAAIAALVAVFALHGNRTVVAEAVVQGTEVRTLAAPFAGFIAEAPKREGDRIRTGDLLVRLDDREFALELTRLNALRAQTELELDKAMSVQDRAEAGLVRSRIRQIDAQITLAEQKIARSRSEAPFDGLVISGDLSGSIGRSVDTGEPLLVIAPLTDYRVDLMVSEDAVDLIAQGQAATLRVAPLPERSFALTLKGTMPVARYENGKTSYLVEGRFVAPPDVLVPGMTGAARITIDRVSLARLWGGPLYDRIRLWVWRNLAT